MSTPAIPVGIATGVGSWPGEDPREAAAVSVGELSGLPHLVELPARGLGADMIGRAAAVLVDLPLDTSTTGYRVAQRPGKVTRRARDLLSRDLDAMEEAWEVAGLRGTDQPVKVQVVGPLTLASQLELFGGHRALTDSGAVRDLAESLSEGLVEHVAEVTRRLGSPVVVQVDEPGLPAVLAGTLPGVSILQAPRAMPEPEALEVLHSLIARLDRPVLVHCCAAGAPLALLRRSGAAMIGLDLGELKTADLDGVGEILEAGLSLALGLVPTTQPDRPPTWRELAEPAVRLMDRLGFPRTVLATQVLVTPGCGLAGASEDWARAALRGAAEVARAFADGAEFE
ncbi:methionine synthase [Rhodococcus tukisamuensis]|uniref:Cobalamin-independent synthase, Catalytic domain n=1 Tax=Rhodococcus tukisamuensis TaxID=168276 RepID=A0A1G6XI40_9NOCA|nr:methionine synthase [Rhodococcus tukisamuensis]SDD77025.1 Cobalamin-independent synthase, Catalytic domain [Rhodococcus tukisamuensis]